MIRRVAVLLTVCSSAAPAQASTLWNDARALELVQRAAERRATQLADTGLLDYTARAHGYLTFLAQLGEGFPDPPKVLKADELALEVYWRAPNLSKQRIIGRRDTLLLATDINYHRDHLGIVQNNFPTIIRLGDGDEVRDVPHPLSASGTHEYDFAITDSLTINLGARALEVFEVRFRPRDDQLPRAVGALYIDRGEAQVARMTLGFTRAALRDPQLDDVSIVLDNGLVDGRFWLPRRQSIEIRRSGNWMDFPARGIIRGRWEICCIEVNTGLPMSTFSGPEIVSAPASLLRTYRWDGRIVDSLPPDMTAAREEDVRKVQADARALVRAQALRRSRSSRLAASGASDLIRVNRVEGLAAGAGLRQRLGAGVSLTGKGRYGFADRRVKGRIAVVRENGGGVHSLSAYDDFRYAGDVQEVSLLRNSLAAQEFGSDYTDPIGARGVALRLEKNVWQDVRFAVTAAYERVRPLAVNSRPAHGTYRPTLQFDPGSDTWIELAVRWPERASRDWAARADLRLGQFQGTDRPAWMGEYVRLFLEGSFLKPSGAGRLKGWGALGGVWGTGGRVTSTGVPARSDGPPPLFVYFGGPVTGPGYSYHQFAEPGGLSSRLEWQWPVPFPRIPLGRFGRTGNRAMLAPFGHLIIVEDPLGGPGLYPSVGMGLLTVFDLFRFDVARGLRGGRWTFSADVSSAFWGIL